MCASSLPGLLTSHACCIFGSLLTTSSCLSSGSTAAAPLAPPASPPCGWPLGSCVTSLNPPAEPWPLPAAEVQGQLLIAASLLPTLPPPRLPLPLPLLPLLLLGVVGLNAAGLKLPPRGGVEPPNGPLPPPPLRPAPRPLSPAMTCCFDGDDQTSMHRWMISSFGLSFCPTSTAVQ